MPSFRFPFLMSHSSLLPLSPDKSPLSQEGCRFHLVFFFPTSRLPGDPRVFLLRVFLIPPMPFPLAGPVRLVTLLFWAVLSFLPSPPAFPGSSFLPPKELVPPALVSPSFAASDFLI